MDKVEGLRSKDYRVASFASLSQSQAYFISFSKNAIAEVRRLHSLFSLDHI